MNKYIGENRLTYLWGKIKAFVSNAISGKVDKVSSSTDNAVVRFDGASGDIQNSGVTINDSNHLTAAKLITSGGTSSQFVKGDGSLDSNSYATESYVQDETAARIAADALKVNKADVQDINSVAETMTSTTNPISAHAMGVMKAYVDAEVSQTIITPTEGSIVADNATIESTEVDTNVHQFGVKSGVFAFQTEVDAIGSKIAQIGTRITQDETEEQIWSNDAETDTYAKINSNGVYGKNLTYNDNGTIKDVKTEIDAAKEAAEEASEAVESISGYDGRISDVEEKLEDVSMSAGGIGTDIEFDTDGNEYVAHIDEDGVHAKDFFLQTSRNGQQTSLKDLLGNSLFVSLPDKIYAVVGDTLQLFYRGMILAPNPYNYDILVSCSKGKQFPRYFEYTPTASDVGSVTFKVQVKGNNGNVLGEATSTLITKAKASSPASQINIACFGDSLTVGGTWCVESHRRLSANDGTPQGDGLNNISFVGSLNRNEVGFYGVGGWNWSSYVTSGSPAFRFQVPSAVTASYGAKYTNNGHTYTIIENNSANGNILCSVSSASDTPSTSGTLTKSSGSGDNEIVFTSAALDSQNPLWDYNNNKMTFIPYANAHCNGQIDVVYTLLSWNALSARMKDFSAIIANVKLFADTLHTEFPNAKLKIMGIQIPSVNGGMGTNYGATGTGYADGYGMIETALRLNAAYQAFVNQEGYSTWVEYVDVASQFDSENNMPNTSKSVNVRNSTTEYIGTNGVHPATSGYYQIADVVYRNIISTILQ